MDILVCVKQVPGSSAVEVDPVTGILKREGVSSKLNPYDLFAIETALYLRERYGGTVRTLSMGPPQARAALLETVWMGADSGVLLSDRAFGGADCLATSYALSQAVRKMAPWDLLLCGKQTTDGDTAQVGSELAEELGIPNIGNAIAISFDKEGFVTVTQNLDDRIVTTEVPLPCLICTDADINTPRLPSYKRSKQISDTVFNSLTLKDLEDKDKTHYGLLGSRTSVERIFPPEKNADRKTLKGGPAEVAAQLADIFKSRKFIG